MTSPILNEGFYSGAFLVREEPGFLSRDAGTMLNPTGNDVLYPGGLVLSLTQPTAAVAASLGANTGNGTFGPITVATPATAGVYVVNFESPTAFIIEGPTGAEFGHGSTGTAFNAGGLGFTITAGATAFAAGDSFTVTVAPGPPGFVPFTGVMPAVAILFNRASVSAGSSRKVAVVARQAEVNGAEIQWDSSVASNAAVQAAALVQLAALGIVARGAAPAFS